MDEQRLIDIETALANQERMVDDLNKTALAYWRDLGLTPAGLKRINEKAMEEKSGRASFADVLRDIGI